MLYHSEMCCLVLSIIPNTVNGESYAWEKFHEFCEFSHSRKTFPPVHFKFHWNQQCIVGIDFYTGMQSRVLFAKLFPRVTFPI